MARTPPEPGLVELVTLLQRQLARSAEEALGRVDLTLDQWRALRVLAADPGMTMGELTDRLLTAPPTTTRLVDGLVDRALVYRRPSAVDRRRVEAALTDAGRSHLGKAESVLRRHEQQVRGQLGADAVDELVRALRSAAAGPARV